MSRLLLLRLSLMAFVLVLLGAFAPAVGAQPNAAGWEAFYYNGILENVDCVNPPAATATGFDYNSSSLGKVFPEGTSPAPGIGTSSYTVCWRTYVNFPSSGNWTFYTLNDDGIVVWLDNPPPPAVWAWWDQSPTAHQGTINVSAGWHSVYVRYYNNTNIGVACVAWAPQGAANPLNCPYSPTSPPAYQPSACPYGSPYCYQTQPAYQPYQCPYGNAYCYPSQPVAQPVYQPNQCPYWNPNCYAPQPTSPPPAPYTWYRVRWGDTLAGIAWKYGTTTWRLAQCNGLYNPNLIYAGMLMRICR